MENHDLTKKTSSKSKLIKSAMTRNTEDCSKQSREPRKNSVEKKTSNSKKVKFQSILNFLTIYKTKNSQLNALYNKCNKFFSETRNNNSNPILLDQNLNYLSNENAKLKISIRKLENKILLAKSKLKEIKLEENNNFTVEKYKFTRFKGIEYRKKCIIEHVKSYENYVIARKEKTIISFNQLHTCQKSLIEEASKTIFPIGVIVSHKDDNTDIYEHVNSNLDADPASLLASATETVHQKGFWMKQTIHSLPSTKDKNLNKLRKKGGNSSRSRSRSNSKERTINQKIKNIRTVSPTKQNSVNANFSNNLKKLNMQQQCYIVSQEICFHDWYLDLHLMNEDETKCREDDEKNQVYINEKETESWQLSQRNELTLNTNLDKNTSDVRNRFYRLESGLWHAAQYLNFLREIYFYRDICFNLELSTLYKLRSNAKITRKSKFSNYDIIYKLDDTINSNILQKIYTRLTCSISSWILNFFLAKKSIQTAEYWETTSKNHNKLLPNLKILSDLLMGFSKIDKKLNQMKFDGTKSPKFSRVLSNSSNSESDFFFTTSSLYNSSDRENREKWEKNSSNSSKVGSPSTFYGSEFQKISEKLQIQQICLNNTPAMKKLNEFLCTDRRNNVFVYSASDDEQLARAFPWSSIFIENDYLTHIEIENLGFEQISQEDTTDIFNDLLMSQGSSFVRNSIKRNNSNVNLRGSFKAGQVKANNESSISNYVNFNLGFDSAINLVSKFGFSKK